MCFDRFCVCFGLKHSKRWRKASKCKKVIKEVWSELKIEKNRINSLVKQSQTDIGQLLENNQDHEALAMVEMLYKYMSLMSAYNQLGHFSARVSDHLPTISKDSVLPTEVSEAVSSLVYAGPRCFKLRGLQLLCKLFEERYGSEFVKINTKLLPGNLVNVHIKEHMCMESVPDDVILWLTSTIASDQNLNQTPEDITLRYKLHNKAYNIGHTNLEAEVEKKPFELETQENCDIGARGQMQISEFKKMPSNVESDYSLAICESSVTIPTSTQMHDVADGMEDLEESSARTTSKDSYQNYVVANLNDTEENQWVQKSSAKEDLSSLKSCNGITGPVKSSAERIVKSTLNQFEREMEYAREDENNLSCRFHNQKMLVENCLSLQSLYV